MNRAVMTDGEVRSRLEAIQRYNDYFATELDKDGQPLTQHIVTEREIHRIMTREWGVDPQKFGIKEPAPVKWNGQDAKPAPENLSDGL